MASETSESPSPGRQGGGPAPGFAPAKVNLFLHVGPVEADGLHPLSSLVAFADVGDTVGLALSDRLSLSVGGPFAAAAGEAADNLVVRALTALGREVGRDPAFAVRLDKALPVAAGLGGGSSDAGAALRLAAAAWGLGQDDPAVVRAARAVGADGPMCLAAVAAWAEGSGEWLTPEPRLPPLAAVLLNPGVASPTGAVYRAYDQGDAASADRPAPPPAWDAGSVIDWLAGLRNDLEGPAIALEPAIGRAVAAMKRAPGVRLARMSGSGATVFGLFDDTAAAARAAAILARDWPQGWVRACVLH